MYYLLRNINNKPKKGLIITLNKHFKNGEPIEGFIWKKEKKENT